MAAPYSVNGATFAPARAHLWSRQRLAAEPGPNPFPYSVSSDGQRIVAIVPDDASDQYSRRHTTLWVNALTELRRPTSSQH